MLFLIFQIGQDRYALEARHAVEVIPFVALQKIPRAPRGLAGIFNYRGRPVPAVDLCELIPLAGPPARELLSTRIIVINFTSPIPPAGVPRAGRELGLIAEHATGMMRCEAREFVSPASRMRDAGPGAEGRPYLGPVVLDEKGVIQLLHAEGLLSETMHELIFTELSRTRDDA